ncbi:hypothetical protein C7974DRAFT_312264 [Boeremia exigua]|uniref:uncharacterized protein n=1 Tax=Boeremia exigua TaxID=749465 RepID=UPI001E8CC0CE|nr:uncharacterized protein C7974DRAFT_312264 [Boeremia exigua]KAH6625396.1 hypothetical protein C7974DRAFT_312264 [Boeremia exigua]
MRLDPIVAPGRVAGHVHTISGGAAFAPTMTYEGMRASKCSSCTIKEDMSNYWTPQLYVKFKNSTFLPVPQIGDPEDTTGGMAVYYLQRRGNDPNEKLHAFPEGFRMLAGDTSARSFGNNSAAKAVSYSCLGGPGLPETNNMPNFNCPGGLRAQIFFPACWNGRDLDTPDHKSHMAYPVGSEYNTGACPPDFPVHMISLFFEVLYDTAPFLDQWDGDQHPFVFSQGDTTGYGYHGDFLNGWDVPTLQRAVDTCTDDSGLVERCSAVTQFTYEECLSCRIHEGVKETNDGLLTKLPGCNPVTHGPHPSAPGQCTDNVALGIRKTNYVDLTTTKQWSYVGCGRDNIADRAFPGPSYSRAAATVEMCVDFCAGQGYTYAGLEYSRECFCANALRPEYAPRDGFMGNCVAKCAGNPAQTCGGSAAMSIYRACGGGECRNNEQFGAAPVMQARGLIVDAPEQQVRSHAREIFGA